MSEKDDRSEHTATLRRSLNGRLKKTADKRPSKGEPCNVSLDFLGVGFLRSVLEDKAFRKKVRRELRGWDKEVRKAERSKAEGSPKGKQNGAAANGA